MSSSHLQSLRAILEEMYFFSCNALLSEAKLANSGFITIQAVMDRTSLISIALKLHSVHHEKNEYLNLCLLLLNLKLLKKIFGVFPGNAIVYFFVS